MTNIGKTKRQLRYRVNELKLYKEKRTIKKSYCFSFLKKRDINSTLIRPLLSRNAIEKCFFIKKYENMLLHQD